MSQHELPSRLTPESRPCAILFPRRDGVSPEDCNGCVLPNGHHGPHEFVASNGIRYFWETDMDCDCEECLSDEPDNWCIVYWAITSKPITFLEQDNNVSF